MAEKRRLEEGKRAAPDYSKIGLYLNENFSMPEVEELHRCKV